MQRGEWQSSLESGLKNLLERVDRARRVLGLGHFLSGNYKQAKRA